MLSLVDGAATPAGHHYHKDGAGKVHHHPAEENFDLARLTAVDFPYIESIFPAFGKYIGPHATIGVHTKRGCPFQCHFCLYNKIEGAEQRYRDPVEVAKEVETLATRYGVRHIWFTDAQFCSTRRSMAHAEAILDELLARRVDVRWTGYLRLNHLTPEIARKMLASGLESLDLSFTGSQDMIDSLTLGYELDQQMDAFRHFRAALAATPADFKVKLYLPLNAPGETAATLRATMAHVEELYRLFGRDKVLPFIFFVGVQPGTPVERRLIDCGYLGAGYDPLTLNPFVIKKLLYNPPPLGPLIGRAYLRALEYSSKRDDAAGEYVGRATLEILARELPENLGPSPCSDRAPPYRQHRLFWLRPVAKRSEP